MPSCTTPTFGVTSQLETQNAESPSRSSILTPTSLEDETSPRKRFPLIETNISASDRWPPAPRRDGWSSVRAPPPARLSLHTNHRSMLSPISSAYSQTPNSLLSPTMFHPKTRSIFSPTLPSTPMSYGKSSMDKSLFSPTTTEPVEAEATVEYLAELVKEKKHLTLFPHMFVNVERLLDDEIGRVRVALFQTEFPRVDLPEPAGDMVSITEKIYVPKNDYPDYNFVGRILGPRGMTAKQLEQDTGCKIMVRGKGSMRDKSKESAHRGKANWEHLEDDLHVLVQCEDTENRVHLKLQAALEQVKKLLVPAPEGTDELKRKQLMELAIINGTYRPMKSPNPARMMTAVPLLSPTPIRSPGPVMLSPTGTGVPTSTFGGSILFSSFQSPTLAGSNGMLGSNIFDYNLLSPSMFDSFSSLQLASDLAFPKYPTTTSFVNSFPGLFTSASSTNSQNTTINNTQNMSPIPSSQSASSVNNTSF
ncbi:CRE-GLD-1 protein [Caenorhabditis remanei]|uniref:CRE-GLD-1 protein n=1 Tax=Caenorhabditis remanei TaxID=31234 RepID=E3MT54_CAERE|nr:CRE-GLD-1 protein [Caenorhabditis remanei]